MPLTRRFNRRRAAIILLLLVCAALLVPNFGGAGAQTTLSEPSILPGDLGAFPAAGDQREQRLSRGDDTYLAVWTDARTMLTNAESGTISPSGRTATGAGSQTDIYAARLGADGQVLDQTPIVVDQGGYEQTDPRVSWNGEGWLVVYTSQKENDHFHYEVRAKRVSPSGQVLDATPIILDPDASFRQTLSYSVIEDGNGNWLVSWEDFLPQEGTSIPRGVFLMRVGMDGTVLDSGGYVAYNHHSQYLSDTKIARAEGDPSTGEDDRYLVTFINSGPPYSLMGLTLGANFTQLRNGPEMLTANATGYDLATDGNAWFVSWCDGASGNVQRAYGSRVTRDGDPVDLSPILISGNISTSPSVTAAAWDGSYWFVAYSTGYNPETQTYLPGGL